MNIKGETRNVDDIRVDVVAVVVVVAVAAVVVRQKRTYSESLRR